MPINESTIPETSPEQKRTVGRAGETVAIDQDTFELRGTDTGTIFGQGTDLQDALALQTALQSGSSPTLSGRPDLLATEQRPGVDVDPFVDTETGQTITPTVATPEQRAAQQAGTLESFDSVRGLPPAGAPAAPDLAGAPELAPPVDLKTPENFAEAIKEFTQLGGEQAKSDLLGAPDDFDNQLLRQKGALMAAMFGEDLTPDDMKWLTAEQSAAILSNDDKLIKAQIAGLNTITQGRKDLKKEEEEKALRQYDLFAASGTSLDNIPEGFLNGLDAQLGLPQGTFTSMYKADFAATEAERESGLLDSALKLDEYLGTKPKGTSVTVGGQTYLGTGTGTAEINNATGDVYMQVADPNSPTGFTYMKTGNIGGPAGELVETDDGNGGSLFWSVQNGVATPISTGGGGGAGIQKNTLMTAYPEGEGFSVDENGKNESWCLQFGYAIAEPGSIPFSFEGVSMDHLSAKTAWTDPSITIDNVTKGTWVITNESKKWGHIALITDVGIDPETGKKTAWLAESNGPGSAGKVHYGRKMVLDGSNTNAEGGIIMGFHDADLRDQFESQDPNKTGQLTSLGTTGPADTKPPTIKKIGDRELQWNPATQAWDPPNVTSTPETVTQDNEKAKMALQLIDDLSTNENIGKYIGPRASALPRYLWSEDKIDFYNKSDRLKNLLTLDNLKLMTGILTDKDIALLASAATELSTEGSEERFREELNRIKTEMGSPEDYVSRSQDGPSGDGGFAPPEPGESETFQSGDPRIQIAIDQGWAPSGNPDGSVTVTFN